ncbi:MAG: ThuA domain-containing protein [Pseudomonadota bacterium]
MTAGVIDYHAPLNALVAVRGHPFDRDPLEAVFQGMAGVAATFVDQPAAAQLMNPDGLAPYDALVLYDMPGVDFTHADAPGYVDPPKALKTGLAAALEAGIGVVALHHAIAGSPAWGQYAEWLGGRFLYRPGPLRGAERPDSGYRHEVRHTIAREPVEAALAPILDGLPDQFEMEDELYLFNVFEEDVAPLLRSGHAFERDGFYSAALAVKGDMFSNVGWEHPAGSNLVAWAKRAGRSPLVYAQGGDGASAYDDANYSRLVENAIRWAASDEAMAWARARP